MERAQEKHEMHIEYFGKS